MIEELPYYWSDRTKLLVTLILKIIEAGTAHRAVPVELDIVESPLNVNGKSSGGAVSRHNQLRLPIPG
ncbi:MAG: hypothetical protein ACREJN_05320 [Nitrospiraceae bacterium]